MTYRLRLFNIGQAKKNILIAFAAFAAGILNGLLGAGGGIVISLVLSILCKDSFSDGRDIFVNAQAAILPISAFSCVLYAYRGMVDFKGFSPYVIPALIGGAAGGFLLSKINPKYIKIVFALIVIFSGVRMMFF